MNSRSIRILRRKFIFSSMLTYFLVMSFMACLINLTNLLITRREIHTVLEQAIDYEQITEISGSADQQSQVDPALISGPLRTYGYFIVHMNDDGEPSRIRIERLSTLSRANAAHYAASVYTSERQFGRYRYYYFSVRQLSDDHTVILFIDCRAEIESHMRLLLTSIIIELSGLVICFILFELFSYRAIKPEIENSARQKQFITNASHELKTPLAVIRANTELLEMMNGESEWTQSTMRQIDRLNGLIANLVMITKAQEREDRSIMQEIDISSAVTETVKPYESLALQDKKQLSYDIPEGIKMLADESKIRQLTALLVDNAFKYCDEDGCVTIRLQTVRKGRFIRLLVSNSYAEGANVDYSRFFERFYREDQSRNVDHGGYGIGLSIAESLCQQYDGTISASWKDGVISFSCLLPT